MNILSLKQQKQLKAKDQRLANALGWFSIGLGAAEILMPKKISGSLGLQNYNKTVRACGFREIMSGLGILNGAQTTRWLQSRVLGDVVDLAFLASARRSRKSLLDPRRSTAKPIGIAIAAVAGITLLDILCSRRFSKTDNSDKSIQVKRSITINRSPEELYSFWHQLENLPRIMNHLESVQVQDQRRSHWVAKAPAGKTIEWDAEIVDDRPNELIAWRSLPGASLENSGTVRFSPAPHGDGTIVTVEMEYKPPLGKAGNTIAKLFGDSPEQLFTQDLRPLKQIMETGEIATTEGQSSGRV